MLRTLSVMTSVVVLLCTTSLLMAQATAPSAPPAPVTPPVTPPTPAVPPAVTTPEKPAAPADPAPVITLIDAGTGEKARLRYALAKGQKTEMTASSTIAITSKMGGRDMPQQKLPEMSSKMTATIAEVDSTGGAKVDVAFTDAQSANPIKGVAMVTSRGTTTTFDIDVPADATPAQKQQIDNARHNATQYFIPFPEEPIGTGAKWKVEQSITQQGMTIQQTITYTWVSREGQAITLAFDVAQTAAEQDIQSPQMPGMKIHLTHFKTAGKGETIVELGSLIGSSTRAEIATDMTMTMPQVGEVQQHMDVAIMGLATITPAP